MLVYRETEIPIYGQKLFFILSDNAEEVNKFIHKKSGGDSPEKLIECDDDLFAGVVDGCIKECDLLVNCMYVYFNHKNKYAALTYGTIAHEALHVINNEFSRIEYDIDKQNDESASYFIGWVVNEIMKFLIEENVSLSVDKKRCPTTENG